jgi:FtsP/CotA-like multicopper oxidase with cupredoxin domain
MTRCSIARRLQRWARVISQNGFLLGTAALTAIVLMQLRPAQAQYTTACPAGLDLSLTQLPEIVSRDGRLKGTIVLADGPRSQVLPATGSQGPNPPPPTCVPQLRRFYQTMESTGSTNGNGANAPPPIPGPTLRASLGDVVELTFLNQIDPLDYGGSIDRWENLKAGEADVPGAGCDSVNNGYPKLNATTYDTMPNCFHGSSTGNLHFHGTHTSPMGTADNVFLGIRPSPRPNDGPPTVTGASVKAEFDTFFQNCEKQLRANNLLEWPLTWKEMDIPTWTNAQEAMLKAYDDDKPEPQRLWPVDAGQIAAGGFPQYYIGSFPYCFLLPKYPGTEQPPGSLQMGQAPGTMWYHAHKHGSTALNVSNGMAGALIIEDNSPTGYDGAIKAFYLKHPNDRKLPGQTEPGPNWPILQTTMIVNQIAGIPSLETGGKGSQAPFSVNGQRTPQVSMHPGEVQLWRIVNASTISGFYLSELPAGFSWRQTAQDGVQFDQDNYKSRAQRPVFVAPGNRIDLLVQAPASLPSGSVAVTVAQGHAQSTAQNTPQSRYKILLTIVLKGNPTPMELMSEMPERPGFLKDIAANEINAPPRSLTFQTAGATTLASQHTIAIDDGPQTKFGENGAKVQIDKLGTVEEWTIYNISNAKVDHPFHIHINPFQVTEVFAPNAPLVSAQGQVQFDSKGAAIPLYIFSGTPLPGQCLLNGADKSTWHPCPTAPSPYAAKTNIWWDVFPIPDATTVPAGAPGAGTVVPGYFKMRTRFVDYPGSYVLHCHILAHEDRGMMLEVDLAMNPSMPHMQHH